VPLSINNNLLNCELLHDSDFTLLCIIYLSIQKEVEKEQEWIYTEKDIAHLLSGMSPDEKDEVFELYLKLCTIALNRLFMQMF
jgi:dethiobiotin synthetase